MPEPAMLDYFYGDEAEQYTFYRIPKVLFTDPAYRRISSDAIAANWNVIVAELEKHSFSNTKLPRQLYKYCPYQIYYAVIAGLRKDFENIRDRKLQLQNENNITLLHYENLIDVANEN